MFALFRGQPSRLSPWAAALFLLGVAAPTLAQAPARPNPRPPAAATPAPQAPSPLALANAGAAAINRAQLVAPPPPPGAAHEAPNAAVIRAEVLLARAHASPGVIDGLAGSNLARAVLAYEQMNGLPQDGVLTPALFARLVRADPSAVAAGYVITAGDVAGPFYPYAGYNLVKAARLPALGYSSPAEELAGRFHMSEALLRALNPRQPLTTAGEAIVAIDPRVPPLPPVGHIEVDKAAASVRAYSAAGVLTGSFPATVGSTERPSPSGEHQVAVIKYNPIYTYDPRKLTWGPKRAGKLTIRPGPNNPVGLVWIGLNARGYGLHGSPNPDKIGKTQSHGCVRMTNWDAVLLAQATSLGDPVAFVGERGAPSLTAAQRPPPWIQPARPPVASFAEPR